MPLFDVKKQLAFYGAYHREPTNVKIHMACVPALLGTGFLFVSAVFCFCFCSSLRIVYPRGFSIDISRCIQGTATPVLARTPAVLQKLNLPLNLGTLAATLYSTLLVSPTVRGLLYPNPLTN